MQHGTISNAIYFITPLNIPHKMGCKENQKSRLAWAAVESGTDCIPFTVTVYVIDAMFASKM